MKHCSHFRLYASVAQCYIIQTHYKNASVHKVTILFVNTNAEIFWFFSLYFFSNYFLYSKYTIMYSSEELFLVIYWCNKHTSNVLVLRDLSWTRHTQSYIYLIYIIKQETALWMCWPCSDMLITIAEIFRYLTGLRQGYNKPVWN